MEPNDKYSLRPEPDPLAGSNVPLDDLPAYDRLAELRRVFAVYWRSTQPMPRKPLARVLEPAN